MQTTKLGGTATDVVVGKTAHGLMMMTWRPEPLIPDEQAFEAIKAGVDALPEGAKMFLNSSEFYANDLGVANLELLARFFDKYPSYADKTFLSVKGGINRENHGPDASPENLRRSVDLINKALRGTKKLDLFEPARVDPNVPIEEYTKTLISFIEEGKFDHLGMSECSAASLRRANAVYPITAVEIEISPWSYEEETKKVLAAAAELNVAVLAYSPLGRGALTGQIQSLADLPENDMRRRFTRFKEESFNHNLKFVKDLSAVAQKKGITPAQLSLAWVSSLGQNVIPLPGSSKATRTLENLQGGSIVLSAEEKAELDSLIAAQDIKGDRYFGAPAAAMHLWG